MTALPQPQTLRGFGAALLLAASVLGLPGRAAATCGDYVTIAGQPGHGAHDRQPGQDDGSPQPCHGPGCSKQPEKPAVPTAPPATAPAQPKHASGGFTPDADSGHSGWCRLESERGSVHSPQPIFHPPRSV